MLLRPATPLLVVLLIAFALLLLSTLSTPIIHAIPLGTYQGWSFGVFGYCNGNTCLGPHIGYSTDGLFSGDNSNGDFSLPSSTRHGLSVILIVHPVAALLTLICCILAIAAHFHSPSSSPGYLLALLIFTIPTLLISLLAFLVDILLFVPHMQWGGWIVLAATILIVASSVLTCAMRRTLISRKARQKRIAENDEMNGANYYENLNQQRLMADQLPRADSPPPIPPYTADKGAPQYATFEMKHQDPTGHDSATRVSEDRTPLNPMRDPSVRSTSTGGGPRRPYAHGDDLPPMPNHGRPSFDNARSMTPPRRPSRDEYGNPFPPMAGEMAPAILRHHGSRGSLTSNGSGRGGMQQYSRGRGNYGPPPGRGYGPPRAGYGPQRGGYGPRGGYRGGPPPPGWNGRGRGGYGPPPPQPPPQDMRAPAPGYDIDPYYSAPRGSPMPMDRRSPPAQDQFVARGPSPGPDHAAIGQAIEMDERTGSPPAPYQHRAFGLGSAGDSADGMLGVQQSRQHAPSPKRHISNTESDPKSPTSLYSENTYVPPRAAWRQLAPSGPESSTGPDHASVSPVHAAATQGPGHTRAGSEPYYEDVDPRFAAEEQSQSFDRDQHTALPTSLMPGSAYGGQAQRMPSPNHLQPPVIASGGHTDRSNSTSSLEDRSENLPTGMRSPAGSDTSHFTSISQRPINPNWHPGMGGPSDQGRGGAALTSASAVQRRKEDMILNGNPDFAIPGISPARGRGRGRGGPVRGTAGTGLTPPGRYPTEI